MNATGLRGMGSQFFRYLRDGRIPLWKKLVGLMAVVYFLSPVDAIPDFIEASVADLDIGSSVHLEDVKLPAGAKSTLSENLTLVTVVAPSGMEEEDAAPAAAEGEAAKA